jgi:hypothetical protein
LNVVTFDLEFRAEVHSEREEITGTIEAVELTGEFEPGEIEVSFTVDSNG